MLVHAAIQYTSMCVPFKFKYPPDKSARDIEVALTPITCSHFDVGILSNAGVLRYSITIPASDAFRNPLIQYDRGPLKLQMENNEE
jgi:hypothetical protein